MILTENNALTKLARHLAEAVCEEMGGEVDQRRLSCVSVHSATDPRRTGYVVTTPNFGPGVGVKFEHLGDSLNDAKRELTHRCKELAHSVRKARR